MPATQTATQLGQLSPVAITFFLLFIAVTLGITYWAARQTKTASEFYSAGGGISGFQNGLALAGDFMSAASFLGIAGLVATGGYNGLIYSVGYLVGWPVVMFLIAEPLRNLGKYTFADVVAYRLQQKPIKTMAAIGSIVTVILYLTAQMVGAGGLIKLMFGLSYETALVAVGILMIAYVTFGGMLATTWVQIIKAILLIAGATLLTALVLNRFGWSYNNLFGAVSQLPNGAALLKPGATDAIATSPIDLISLALGLMFGTAGLPHILMRFYTVPDAREARKSVFVATGFIGYFYILTFTIGFGAAALVSANLLKKEAEGGFSSNMAAPLLAEILGGGPTPASTSNRPSPTIHTSCGNRSIRRHASSSGAGSGLCAASSRATAANGGNSCSRKTVFKLARLLRVTTATGTFSAASHSSNSRHPPASSDASAASRS